MADTATELARLEADVAQLLQQIPTAGSNSEQLELLQRAQEIVLNRDPSGTAHRLLHAALPFLQTLLHQQNAPLVAAILQLLAEASRRDRLFLTDLFDAVTTVLLLSYSSEKNVTKALDLATTSLLDAFQFVAVPTTTASSSSAEQLRALWLRVSTTIDHVAELVSASPLVLLSDSNNRSAAVFLRAWKLLERAILVLCEAKDATLYRDPARSNVQPDAVTVDLVASSPSATATVLDREQLLAQGDALLRRLVDRLLTPSAGAAPLSRRELCVALNSLSLLAALRPQLLPLVLPALIAVDSSNSSTNSPDRAVQATLKANLVKLLSHPAAQELAEEVTECVIASGDGERAFRAISKSKDPRRKYVKAPSEAMLRRARIGKRTAAQISDANDPEQQPSSKRGRSSAPSGSSSSNSTPDRITMDALVNMPSTAVLSLVLRAFGEELPPAAPGPALPLLLPPSELKSRMSALLARVATPSSVLALETSQRRSRDPRRNRQDNNNQQNHASLVRVFDDETVDEMSDWIASNATTVEEPLVSLADDNSVQVFLKPVSSVWCRDMAAAALTRILENEHGASIRGDGALRETLLCRLASSPWLLLTDERNAVVPQSTLETTLPPVYQTILDFVLEDVERRTSLAMELLHHEYVRVASESPPEQDQDQDQDATERPPVTGDVYYKKAVAYFLSSLVQRLDLSSSSDKKLFGSVVAQLPRVTVDVLRVATSLFADPFKTTGGAVLGIIVLRDLVRERRACGDAALRVLLQFTCDADELCRISSIRCVANQLYAVERFKKPIEEYAFALVTSLEEPVPTSTTSQQSDQDVAMDDPPETPTDTTNNEDTLMAQDPTTDASQSATAALRSPWLRERLARLQQETRSQSEELCAFAHALHHSASHLDRPLDSEVEVLRRLELYLALCAKKPALLRPLIHTYGRASEMARQVIFQAIEKLIKHLKQRSSGVQQVIAQLQGFEAPALGLVCHIIHILATRTATSKPTVDESRATGELVNQILALWRACDVATTLGETPIPDAIQVLIPIIASIPKDTLLPLLPALLSLPQSRWSVAITRVLEAAPPQVLSPIDLLVVLHHVDLKHDAGMQKKVISAINFCLENRHAFPAEVLLHVSRVLLHEELISKLAMRTLILSVTTYPALQQDAAQLLKGLVTRRVWELPRGDDGDALWKGFVKCVALIQPASFPMLLDSRSFPLEQLTQVLQLEPALRGLLCGFVTSPEVEAAGLVLSDSVRELLMESDDIKTEEASEEPTEETATLASETVDSKDNAVKTEEGDDDQVNDTAAPMDVEHDA